MSDLLNVPIARIEKNSREEIRIGLSEYRGAQFVDVRVFTTFAGASDARTPTKAGVAIGFDKLEQVIRALHDAYNEADSRGLIPNPEPAP